MGSEVAKAKKRAESAFSEAVQQSYHNMAGVIPVDYTFRLWSRSIFEIYVEQWLTQLRSADAGWDWLDVSRRHKENKDVVVALFSRNRLSALCLIRASRARVLVRLLEGDPRPDCHMKGSRALLLLDLAATYGQRLGCGELHLQPVNDALAELYKTRFGFVDAVDGSGEPILKRSLR
ncbi:hypothetical protein [Roseivivax sp. THAF40]|uniref:hypothetical protein n=1 Tax=Roseivivax sp. THAF40 TaxID=2587858 RepID=UPI001269217E|nr:hypothetical protein [Roseivivax sp. THAF40]